MTGIRTLDSAVLVLSVVTVLVSGSVGALLKTVASMMPRAPGIWAVRNPPRSDAYAIIPTRSPMLVEDSENETPRVRVTPAWNQNRSGDAFVALLLALVVPWTVMHCISRSPMRLWAECQLMLFGY